MSISWITEPSDATQLIDSYMRVTAEVDSDNPCSYKLYNNNGEYVTGSQGDIFDENVLVDVGDNGVWSLEVTDGTDTLTFNFNVSVVENNLILSKTITQWDWDFGDGETSSAPSPYHIYKNPGFYDVKLTVTQSDGEQKTIVKSQYIHIHSVAEALFTDRPIDNKLCLVYGMGFGEGSGWSEFSGDRWVFPENLGSLVLIENDDDILDICFDFETGLPFIINTRDKEGNKIKSAYRDMIGLPGYEEGFPIESVIVTPQFAGEERKYRIKHEETFVDIRPLDVEKGYEYLIKSNAYLLIDGERIPSEIITDIRKDSEFLFVNTEMGDRVQVGLDFSESGWSISAIESIFTVSDTARYATKTFSTSLDFQIKMASVKFWYTRPDATFNRGSGTYNDFIGQVTQTVGADGYMKSGFIPVDSIILPVAEVDTLMFWYLTNDAPDLIADGNPLIYDSTDYNGWSFVIVDLRQITEIQIEGGKTLFDLRVVHEYIDKEDTVEYINDVLNNKGNKFLVGYVEYE